MSTSAETYLNEFAHQAANLGQVAADIAGSMDDLTLIAQRQTQTFQTLARDIDSMVETNKAIHAVAQAAEKLAVETRTTVEDALKDTRSLAVAVSRVEQGIASVGTALHQVANAAEEIGQIAFQTRIVAFNASVEAVRAGEAGKGFAVVADAVKDLAQRVQSSSKLISSTVDQLNQRVEKLAKEVEAESHVHGGNAETAVDVAIRAFRSSFGAVADNIHQMSRHAQDNLAACKTVLSDTQAVNQDLANTNHTLGGVKNRAHELLGLSERLIEVTAESGVETEDTPYIDAVMQAAQDIAELFEVAVDSGQISINDLFDEKYVELKGTNPPQHLTRFTAFTDQMLPPIQESMLQLSSLVAFCAAVDRNGYLPTHNLKFSKPQGRNPEWNAANCRNRRIFNDRTGLAAGRNTNPFLLQTYRRDMGGGSYVLMKDLSAPIFVKGRHWGGWRLGYKFA